MVIFTVTFTAPPKQENGKQTDCACAAGAIAIRTAKNDVSAIRAAKMRRGNLLKGTGGSLARIFHRHDHLCCRRGSVPAVA